MSDSTGSNTITSTSSYTTQDLPQQNLVIWCDDFEIQDRVSEPGDRNPLLIVSHPKDRTKYAAKVFFWEHNESQANFFNEERISNVSHNNIVNIIYSYPDLVVSTSKGLEKCSLVLMELARTDFFKICVSGILSRDEKLCRTYFRQLVEGVEHLHKSGISHMDLKADNLLLGEDFCLKLADFELSYSKRDPMILGHGTKNFRAPELMALEKEKSSEGPEMPEKCDIYSLGILLFVFRFGTMPYDELAQGGKCGQLRHFMLEGSRQFWSYHIEKGGVKDLKTPFTNLVESMVKRNPNQRAKIEDIKESKWYKGDVYEVKELRSVVEGKLNFDLVGSFNHTN